MSTQLLTPPFALSSASRAFSHKVLAVFLAIASATIGLAVATAEPADAQGIAAPGVCAVTNADAGAFVFWSAVPGANEYVYATRFNNSGERFARTPESSLFIPREEGRVTALRVATVIGGATSNSTICSIDGAGGPPPPPTQPPATQPPATQPPATQPPATQPPATQPPATQPPATQPPATQPPATQPPATQPPATQPPATQPPATQPPATQPPATQPPATQPPATQPPATQPPATQPPATQPPATQPPTASGCHVTHDPIGVAASWDAVPGAVEYVYALRYNGVLRFDRVAGTSTKIAVTPGKDVNVDVSAVFADGSYSPAVDCGTARTTDTSSGGCVSQALDGAIQVDYPATDDAVAYVFALRVNSGPVFYNRVEFTSLRFEIGSGATGHTTISAVFADGTSTEVATCASVAAN